MSDNPYSPPIADVEPAFGEPTGGTGTFSIGQCFSDAWATTWRNFPQWLGVGLVAGFLMALSMVTVVGIFLIWPVLLYGGVVYVLAVHDGAGKLADLWKGFSNFGSTLGSGLGLMFLLAILAYAGQIPLLVGTLADSAVLSGVGQIINLVWSFVMVRFYFALFLWVEHGTGPVDAIGQSWTMTARVAWKMVGLMLLLTVLISVPAFVIVLGMIPAVASESSVAIGIGSLAFLALILPLTMISYMLFVSAYRQMVGSSGAAR